ncbi:hypothetical protein PsorP6_006306 [Peronosclerospora sorghi]|uniref:Uncharacterized protein n=1 Tax=Peronosclerospora sorghi TaxID=230839 RepID=A0ACC0W360_9STRA|nr:hypothetical protein PsorP6_006306 [Peronosclerospora sorghi]
MVAALARAHAQAQARSEAVAQVENRENVLEQTNGNHEQEHIPNDNDATRKCKRAIQQVASVETRVKVIKWMVKDAEGNGEKGVAVRAIKNFQADFRGEYKANHMKCTRWWKDREGILTAADDSVKSISTVLNTGVKRVQVKVAVGGRGRQRDPWTERLHELLLVEFSRMRATGAHPRKFNEKTSNCRRLFCAQLHLPSLRAPKNGRPNMDQVTLIYRTTYL